MSARQQAMIQGERSAVLTPKWRQSSWQQEGAAPAPCQGYRLHPGWEHPLCTSAQHLLQPQPPLPPTEDTKSPDMLRAGSPLAQSPGWGAGPHPTLIRHPPLAADLPQALDALRDPPLPRASLMGSVLSTRPPVTPSSPSSLCHLSLQHSPIKGHNRFFCLLVKHFKALLHACSLPSLASC